MNQFKRPVVIVGNWKMHKTNEEAAKYMKELIPLIQTSSALIYLAVPYTALSAVASHCIGTKIVPGAQNMNNHEEGPFTGEISGKMLQEAGGRFVILGHSERRQHFHETNEFINKKVKKALKIGLVPILCFGETAVEREQGQTIKVLTSQLKHCLVGLNGQQVTQVILAYEPIWAIGTQQAAMPSIAEEIHRFFRQYLSIQYGRDVAEQTTILYGGSVNPENVDQLLEQQNVDGCLVGAASLSAEKFGKIIHLSTGKHPSNTITSIG